VGAEHENLQHEEPPRVTASMLRRAEEMCRRRLAREHLGSKRHANRTSSARFAVLNRLVGDARLAHATEDAVRADAFVEPVELEPEQRALYRAAARGYLTMFGERPGRAVDLGWRTELSELGVDLVGDPGIAFEPGTGGHELRILKVGARRGTLLDPVELRCALVRTQAWAGDDLRIVAVDLLEQESATYVPDLTAERLEAHAWMAARVEVLTRNAADGRPRAGADCAGCAFIAGCPAHV
jgi:hypothetical protein